MKGIGFIFGTVLTVVVKVLYKILKILIEFLAVAILRLGLFVPILYLIYGGILQLIFGFVPFCLSTDSQLYILGFALSLVCAGIIAVRSLIINPFQKHYKKSNVIEYKDDKRLSKDAPEPPIIYKSRVNKGITVYEYSNRYDMYEEYRDGLRLVDTEYKKAYKKPKRF